MYDVYPYISSMNNKSLVMTITDGIDTRKHQYSIDISKDSWFLDEVCEKNKNIYHTGHIAQNHPKSCIALWLYGTWAPVKGLDHRLR